MFFELTQTNDRHDDDKSEDEDGRQGRIEATLVILAQNHRFGDRPVPRPLARVSHGRSGEDAGDAGDAGEAGDAGVLRGLHGPC